MTTAKFGQNRLLDDQLSLYTITDSHITDIHSRIITNYTLICFATKTVTMIATIVHLALIIVYIRPAMMDVQPSLLTAICIPHSIPHYKLFIIIMYNHV